MENSSKKYLGIPVSRKVIGCAAALLCEILFGFSFLFTKNAVNSVSPVDLLGWRFAAAAAVMGLCVLCRFVRVDLKGKKLLPLMASGLLFPGAYYMLEAFGVSRLTVSETGMMVAQVPAITLLFSMIFLKEHPSWKQVIGIFLSIFGMVLCVAAKQSAMSLSVTGYLLLGQGITSFCAFTVCTRKIQEFTSVEKTFIFLVEAFVIYFSTAIVKNSLNGSLKEFLLLPAANHALLYSVLYLSCACSVLCLFLCNFSISCIGPSCFTSFIGVETVVSVAAGILILHEPVLLLQFIGAAVIICGVYTTNSRSRK